MTIATLLINPFITTPGPPSKYARFSGPGRAVESFFGANAMPAYIELTEFSDGFHNVQPPCPSITDRSWPQLQRSQKVGI